MATAEIHATATLTPSKPELLASWLPTQHWFDGDASAIEREAAFRLVDPAGEVGIETIIVSAGERTFQVPWTYRSAPLVNAEAHLVAEMHHSVLGRRWVYDALGDPVYLAEIRRVIAEGDHEAELSQGDPTMTARGSGTERAADDATIEVVRDVDQPVDTSAAIGTLTGAWQQAGTPRKATLVVLRP